MQARAAHIVAHEIVYTGPAYRKGVAGVKGVVRKMLATRAAPEYAGRTGARAVQFATVKSKYVDRCILYGLIAACGCPHGVLYRLL